MYIDRFQRRVWKQKIKNHIVTNCNIIRLYILRKNNNYANIKIIRILIGAYCKRYPGGMFALERERDNFPHMYLQLHECVKEKRKKSHFAMLVVIIIIIITLYHACL